MFCGPVLPSLYEFWVILASEGCHRALFHINGEKLQVLE